MTHYKINLDKDIDPTFGHIVPQDIEAFIVDVTPAIKKPQYHLVTILPQCETKEKSIELLGYVLEEFLEEGDLYNARSLTLKDEKFFEQGTPVISFNPETDEFVWLVPPKDLMH